MANCDCIMCNVCDVKNLLGLPKLFYHEMVCLIID